VIILITRNTCSAKRGIEYELGFVGGMLRNGEECYARSAFPSTWLWSSWAWM